MNNSLTKKWISYLDSSSYWNKILPTGMLQHRLCNVSTYLDFSTPQTKTPFTADSELHYAINHPYDLLEAIRKNDATTYIDEALFMSWPIKKAMEKFKEVALANVPKALHNATFKDLFKKPSKKWHGKVMDYGFIASNDFLFGATALMFVDDGIKDIVKKLVDEMYVTGYHLSMYETVHCDKKVNGKDVSICFMQFEARYSRPTFDFSDILYHVSPSRYFKKIKEHGILPYSKNDFLKYPDRVYLFNNSVFSYVKNYGAVKSMQLLSSQNVDYEWVNDNTFIVYAIDTKKLMQHQQFKNGKMVFYIDPCYNGKTFGLSIIEAIYTYSAILKELLYPNVFVYSIEWHKGKAQINAPRILPMANIPSL